MYEPIKKLGQNFLSDPFLARKMVEELDIHDGDVVVEIGPGHGFLTEELAVRVIDMHTVVYAVEIDRRFVEKLENMFLDESRLIPIEDDILRWLPDFTTEKPVRVIGSLPFYITSPIVHTTIKMKCPPVKFVYLVQKEVAEKICSKPPEANYLSSFVGAFYDAEFVQEIPREKFEPIPKVDGAIISCSKKDNNYSREFIEKFEGFMHRAYKNPRKMLNKAFKKEELALQGLDPKLRSQNVEVSDWLELFNKLNK